MKRVTIWGKRIDLQGSPLTLLIFKKAFGTDLTKHLNDAYHKNQLDIEDFLRVAWAMAKTNNDATPEYEEWLASFDQKLFKLSDIPIGVINSAIEAEFFCHTTAIEKNKFRIARFLERLAQHFSA